MTNPVLNIIFATDIGKAFGLGKQLPWPDNKDDFLFFKAMTLNNNVIMGRKTWESLPAPLTGRHNIVLSKKQDLCNGQTGFSGELYYKSPEDYLNYKRDDRINYIIGGAKLIEEVLLSHKYHIGNIYLTLFRNKHKADVLIAQKVLDLLFVTGKMHCNTTHVTSEYERYCFTPRMEGW